MAPMWMQALPRQLISPLGATKDQFAKSWRRNELQPEHPRSSPLLSHVHELNFGRFPPRPSELPASWVIV
jgi:hypothetical protein